MLIETVLKLRGDFSMKNFECSEINVIGLPAKKWTALHTKYYSEYEYSDHTRKIFISFEHSVSSDGYRFRLLNWGILFNKLCTFHGKNAGFKWFEFYWIGFIELNLYLDVVEQNTIKKPTLSSVTAYIFTEFRAMHTVVYLKIAILIS